MYSAHVGEATMQIATCALRFVLPRVQPRRFVRSVNGSTDLPAFGNIPIVRSRNLEIS